MALHAAVARQGVSSGVLLSSRCEFFGIKRRILSVPSTRRHMNKAFKFSAQISVEAATYSSGGNDGKDNNKGCFNDAMGLIGRAPILPELVVVDLDYTVWPLYCQYKALTDTPAVYPQAVDIIKALAATGITLAVASRTPALAVAMDFMEKLSIVKCFSYLEIYFTVFAKTKHFYALKEKTGIPYRSMLFFDDEAKNLDAARKLGVNTVMVRDGLNLKALEEGLSLLASNR